jgi:hypothetical protein
MAQAMEYIGTSAFSGRAFKRNPLPLPQGNTFVRALTAKAVGIVRKMSPQEAAALMWPSDKLTLEVIERAASAPAMTTVSTWAAELAQRTVNDMLAGLGPATAAAEVFKRSLLLDFAGRASISAPGFSASGANSGFVAEGDPIPVRQLSATPALLTPFKLASIAVLTREMIESSNAEQLIGDALMRSAGCALDDTLFDVNPATAARPAGLRNGIAALTASNNADSVEAFAEDLTSLINAVSSVGQNGPYLIVVSPGRAVSMALRFIFEASNVVVLGTNSIGGDMLAIAPAALVAALDPAPHVEVATAAALHMDSVPSAVPTAGPRKSMYQTDSLALKIRWPVSWALRDPRGISWLTPNWK